jgi:hypothetical protein
MHGTIQPAGIKTLVLGDNLRVERQIREALSLSEFAVKSGFKASDGTPIPPDIISHIETASAKLGFLKEVDVEEKEQAVKEASSAALSAIPARGSISASEWVEFELAYYKLSTLMSPITAQSVNDTEPDTRCLNKTALFSWAYWRQKIFGSSPATRFTKGIWFVAICFAVFVVCADCFLSEKLRDGNITGDNSFPKFVQILILYAYGGLGACAYLLRSAHTFIYKRTFDVRRQPEYYNRILLGAIAGGTITLFVNQTAGDEGATVQLSSAALSFIAGYSTDFLFSKIENIINVLLPKDKDKGVKSSNTSRSALRHGVAEPDVSPNNFADRDDKAKRQRPRASARTRSNERHRKATAGA